jgi:hypothetical protein
MHPMLRFATTTMAVAGLAACANTQGRTASPRDVPVKPGAQFEGDMEYVATVEHIARRRGVQVYWFHPPVRRAPPSTQ